MKKELWFAFAALMVLGLLAGCAQPAPQVIEKPVTVVVEKEVRVKEEVLATVIVEKEVAVEKKVIEEVVDKHGWDNVQRAADFTLQKGQTKMIALNQGVQKLHGQRKILHLHSRIVHTTNRC